ncbi:hypothetical protein CVIRNUC_000305 [Coccomyxa viridis]|uniref:Uncharacterized protein n=1 Tax=Coccomyxa viridis TaxID=1274662 RepID=A0AAV1HQZ8_9CHLO|nr:hypothetical protein CVIRNUC_000305 [Coccomyxa viridis]
MPIRTLKINDNYTSELLGIRGLGLGSFFPQASGSKIDSAIVHLVPELSGRCRICSAPWACQDPVEAGWLKTTGTLYGEVHRCPAL